MEKAWSVREYREGDEKGILQLTEAIYGEVPDKEQWMRWWNWRFRDGPSGAPVIWLAESNGKLVGQYLVTSVKMKVGSEADLILYQMVGNKAYRTAFQKSGFIFSRLMSRSSRFIGRINTNKISEAFLTNPRHWFVQIGDSDLI